MKNMWMIIARHWVVWVATFCMAFVVAGCLGGDDDSSSGGRGDTTPPDDSGSSSAITMNGRWTGSCKETVSGKVSMIDLNLVHVGDSITGTAVDSLYGNFSVQGGLNGSLHTLHLISDTDPSNFSVGDVHYIAIRIAEFTSTTMEGIVEIGRFGYGSRLDGTWSGYKE